MCHACMQMEVHVHAQSGGEKDLQVLVPLHLAPRCSVILKVSGRLVQGSLALLSFLFVPVRFVFPTLIMR